jgi:hypothetical protein
VWRVGPGACMWPWREPLPSTPLQRRPLRHLAPPCRTQARTRHQIATMPPTPPTPTGSSRRKACLLPPPAQVAHLVHEGHQQEEAHGEAEALAALAGLQARGGRAGGRAGERGAPGGGSGGWRGAARCPGRCERAVRAHGAGAAVPAWRRRRQGPPLTSRWRAQAMAWPSSAKARGVPLYTFLVRRQQEAAGGRCGVSCGRQGRCACRRQRRGIIASGWAGCARRPAQRPRAWGAPLPRPPTC